MKKNIIIALLFASALMLNACGSQAEEQEKVIELAETSESKPQTVTVERGDIRVSTSYDALVEPRVVQLTFEDEGTL